MVNDFLKHFNYSRSLNSEQVVKVVDIILLDYKHWSMLDVNECLKRAIRGEYGGFYEGIDVAKMINIFERFDKDLANELHEQHLNKKKQDSKPFEAVPAELLAKLSERFNAKKMPEPKPIVRTELDIKMNEYFKEFDKLFKDNPKSTSGQRFVEYKGRIVGVTEYCEIRFSE